MRNSLILCLSFWAGVVMADETILLEENGFLVFEVESLSPSEGWSSTTDISGYTGTGYFQWVGDTQTNINSAGRGALTYHFRITNPGNYELRWRSRIAEGSNRTEHNDSWVRFATGENISGEQALDSWTKAYMNVVGEWSWQTGTVDHNRQAIRQYFSAGDHTIEISGRSRGHAIDRVVLYNYDIHDFSEDSFETSAASLSVNGPVVLPEPQTDPEPATGLTPEPAVESNPELVTTSEETSSPESVSNNVNVIASPAGECVNDQYVLPASDGLYTQNENLVTSGDIRVEAASRIGYLRFDRTPVPSGYSTVSLEFEVGSDNGSGVLDVYVGGHADWSAATTAIAGLPAAAVLAGSVSETWDSNRVYRIGVDPSLLPVGSLSLLLELQGASNDFSIKPASVKLAFSGYSDVCMPAANNSISVPAVQAALGANTAQSGGGAVSLWYGMLLLLAGSFSVRGRPVVE